MEPISEQPPSSMASEPRRPSKKTRFLVALAWVTVICAAVRAFMPEDSPYERPLMLVQMIPTLVLLLLWCHHDSSERGYRLSKGLSILIVLVAVVGLPIYLLRTRPGAAGFVAILKAAAFFGFLLAVDYLVAQVTYLACTTYELAYDSTR